MKKIVTAALALVIALSLALPVFAITDPNVTEPGQLPVVKEPITLSVGITQDSNTLSYAYGENYQTTTLQDMTGVKLEWVMYPAVAVDANSKLRLQISGGETLPDVLIGFDLDNDAVRESYGQAGAIIPLNDYIENISYFHKEALSKTKDAQNGVDLWKMGRSLDGNYYGMMRLYRTLPNHYSGRAWYNREFVAALNMEEPEGVPSQEWMIEYLRGVRDNDVNGNGDKNDEVPLIGGIGWNQNLIYWLLKEYTYIDYTDNFFQLKNGQLSNSYTKDEFREGLRFIKSMYDESLFPDYALTQDNTNYNAMIAAETPFIGLGVSGSCSGFGANMFRMNPIPVVEGPTGFTAATFFPQNPFFGTVITKDCKYPEAAFRMFDAENSDPNYVIYERFGEPNVDWKLAEEGTVGMYESMGIPGYFTILQSVWGVPQKSHWAGQFFSAVDFGNLCSRFTWDGNEQNNEYKNALAVTKQVDYAPAEYVAKIIYSVEEQETWANTRAAIATYVKECMALFVTGQMDIETQWDEFQANIKALDSEGLLAMDQTALERTNA